MPEDAQNLCTQCKAPLKPDTTFCTSCGAKQTAPAALATAVSSAAPETPVPPSKPARIYVHSGADRGASYDLTGKRTIIGRGVGSGIQLNDPLVSSSHCAITAGAELASIEDLGSSNGTLAGGETIPTGTVKAVPFGTMLQLGDTIAEIVGPGTEPRMAAPTITRSAPAAAPASAFAGTRARAAIACIAIVAVGALGIGVWAATRSSGNSSSSSPSAAPHDPAWVMKTQAHTAVQVFACENSTQTHCDNTLQSGSGSVIDLGSGLVLTNFHVIANDNSDHPLPDLAVAVSEPEQDYVSAEVVGFSACDDLAVLRITGDAGALELAEVTLGSGGDVAVGDEVVALGFPGTVATTTSGDEQLQLTTGNVSALGVKAEHYRNLLQMSTPINHGNSGGPVFNLDGKQVGVATLGDGNDTQGIFYAISIDQVNGVLQDLRDGTRQEGLDQCPK